MDNEKTKKPYITDFLRDFAKIFTMIVIIMSLTGKIIANNYPDAQNTSSIFVLGSTGLPYSAIFQFIGLAFVLTIFSRVLFYGFLEEKLSYLWKFFLIIISNLLSASIFAIVFKWFPIDNMRVWLTAFLAIIISSSIAIVLSILFMTFENRKYNKLLENYKKRHSE